MTQPQHIGLYILKDHGYSKDRGGVVLDIKCPACQRVWLGQLAHELSSFPSSHCRDCSALMTECDNIACTINSSGLNKFYLSLYDLRDFIFATIIRPDSYSTREWKIRLLNKVILELKIKLPECPK